jgi:hypothetical protein
MMTDSQDDDDVAGAHNQFDPTTEMGEYLTLLVEVV